MSEFRFNINGLKITCDEPPYVVFGEPVKKNEDNEKLLILISEDAKRYEHLRYTTSLDALKLILGKRTFRSSSLTYANLNDKMEKERVGVSQFAGGRFITCFSHCGSESVWFWSQYGGDDPKRRVQLKFKNFCRNLEEKMLFDYCNVKDEKKCFFNSEEYGKTVNTNGLIGELCGIPKIHEDFDLRAFVDNVQIFDVEYVSVNHEVFTEDHSGVTTISFSDESGVVAPETKMQAFDSTCLGKQKSDPWKVDEETRIMCCLGNQNFKEWDYIDLRLKDEIFRDLTIILSPWAGEQERCEIEAFVNEWKCNEDIKNSITIVDSSLKGTINF